MTLYYQWGILAFLRTFKLENFAFTPEAFYQLGLQIFKLSDNQVLAHILNYFVEPISADKDKYEQLTDDINLRYPAANLSFPAGQEPSVPAAVALIKSSPAIPADVSRALFEAYLLDADEAKVAQRLQEFYNIIVPGGFEAYIRDLIIPKFRASLTVSAGIEFRIT